MTRLMAALPPIRVSQAAQSDVIKLSAQGDCPYAAPGRGKLCDDGVAALVRSIQISKQKDGFLSWKCLEYGIGRKIPVIWHGAAHITMFLSQKPSTEDR